MTRPITMARARLASAGALLACMFAAGSALAGVSTVSLSGAQETPPVQSAASGDATLTVGGDHSISGTITTHGVVSTVAHIHLGPAGQSGPPVVSLTRNGDDSWVVPPGTVLTDEQYGSYLAGNLYINVHSADNKRGEIRGQIRP